MTTANNHTDGETTVLVVDDERDVADLYSTWLEAEYEVRSAYGPKGALEQADEDVDVVFLDRQMPEMTGDEVLERLRDRDLDCRVVMVTAVDPDFDIVDMPFDDYLTKPVMMDDLADAIERMLARDTYGEHVREYYAVASKKATLEAQKDPVELEESEEYEQLETEVQQMRQETDQTVDEMESQDFKSMFKEFPSGYSSD